MVWLEIMKELQKAFSDVAPHVIVGALEPADYANDGVVFLIRDGESIPSLKSLHEDMQGTVNLLIENWVRDDTTDIYNGYGKLAEQEDKMIGSIKSWLVNRNTDDFSILELKLDQDGSIVISVLDDDKNEFFSLSFKAKYVEICEL